MDIATEKAKERKREAILCNGNWERYNNTIEDELKKHKEVSYVMTSADFRLRERRSSVLTHVVWYPRWIQPIAAVCD